MKITVNGNATEVPDGLTVTALIAQLGLHGPVQKHHHRHHQCESGEEPKKDLDEQIHTSV